MLVFMVITGLTILVLGSLYLRERIRFSHFQRDTKLAQNRQQQELLGLQDRVQLQSRDPVTGKLGWQLFEDRVTQGIKECARYKFIMGVMYVDIDNFKLLNDGLGYELANKLLHEVAERLQTCVRQVDSIGRQGKDTFVVLLAQLAKQETAIIIVQRMFQVLSDPFIIDGQEQSLTACIGLSFYPADGVTTGELMQHAEYAMLLAKAKGTHVYQFYQEDLHADSQRELALHNSLSSDAFLDELSISYQPIMDVKNQETLCTDALISWDHPTMGNVPANELFTLADQQGKLNDMTVWMLAKACKKFLHWHSLGLKPKMLGIPVMLKQLESTHFIYKLSQVLKENEMKPECVMLELRGCNATVSLDVLEKSFNMLKYIGVKIAVVHFGSGSFPLRYLKIFSVDYLKLDKVMISDVALNEQTKAMIKAILTFAAIMSLDIVACGVEEESQSATLSELGVGLLQGRLLGEPLSEQEMVAKITDA